MPAASPVLRRPTRTANLLAASSAALILAVLSSLSLAAAPAHGATLAEQVSSVRIAGRDQLQLLDAAGTPLGTLSIPTAHAIHDALRSGNQLYVACGPDGVLIFDLTASSGPQLVSRIGSGRNAVRLAQSGGQLLVVVAEYGVLAYSLADPQHPQAGTLGELAAGPLASAPSSPGGTSAAPASLPAAPPSPTAAAPAVAASAELTARSPARVTKVVGGWVAIASDSRIAVGDRFLLRSQRLVRTVDPTSGRSERAPSNEPLGILVVERLRESETVAASGSPTSPARAQYVGSGRLLRGTVVRAGDLAEPTSEHPREPLYVPRLWYGMSRFYGHLRPMFGVSPLTYGMLNDFRFEHYFRVPIKLGVSVAPLAFLTTSPVAVISEVRGHLAFSSSYFELSLDPGGILNRFGGMAFSFGFSFRLGSLDGLNLIFRSSYRLRGGAPSFDFHAAGGEINIPLAKRFTLHLASEGSTSYIWGTLGLKYWLRGSGGPGTLILDTGVGGMFLEDSCWVIAADNSACSRAILFTGKATAAGPAASLGLDARF